MMQKEREVEIGLIIDALESYIYLLCYKQYYEIGLKHNQWVTSYEILCTYVIAIRQIG